MFVEKIKGAFRIIANDQKALDLGLSRGLNLADARARVPNVEVLEMDWDADAVFLNKMADWCDRYTPLVMCDGQDGLVLDVTGCVHFFASEADLRADLVDRMTKIGVQLCASIASTPDMARAMARFGDMAIVEPLQSAQAIYPLPIVALGLDTDSLTGLLRAGLKTIGDLAQQPRMALAARFGGDILHRLEGVIGEKDNRISPRHHLDVCVEERRFAEPIGLEADILQTILELLERLERVLERRREGGREFVAVLFRTDGEVVRIKVETGRPLKDAAILTRLFRERLDGMGDPLDPGFGFDLVRLHVVQTEPLSPLQTNFDQRQQAHEELAGLIDRLSTRFGVETVRRIGADDTHIPERAAHMVSALSAGLSPVNWAQFENRLARPFQIFDPPQIIEALAEVPDGPPLKFRWRRVLHEIAFSEGPERIGAEWWHDGGMTRDYYRIEDIQGRRYWVFRDGLYGAETPHPCWYLHGIFP